MTHFARSGWWAISSEDLRAMLQRVADGEDPAEVYEDAYASARHDTAGVVKSAPPFRRHDTGPRS